MGNLCFFQTLTPQMTEECGLFSATYQFTYKYKDDVHKLQQKGSSFVKLSDPLNIWNVESEGIILNKEVRIAYPDLLKGPTGVVCRGAEYGVCIIWTNKKLTQTGYILPISDESSPSGAGRVIEFEHTFAPGTLAGDLELSLVIYVEKSAETVLDDEAGLINETGVIVGEMEKTVIDFNSIYMSFPIEEVRDENGPLWWLYLSEWEDPKTIDMFSKDSLCLYLNSWYDACPAPTANGIKNFDLLVDILAQAYFLMFHHLDEGDLTATVNDVGLAANSVCSVLHQFINDCIYEDLHLKDSPQNILRSLQINIRRILLEEGSQ